MKSVHSTTIFQPSKKINGQQFGRVFIGLDGRTMVADRYGAHVATAAAIALHVRPIHRIAGFRAEVGDE